ASSSSASLPDRPDATLPSGDTNVAPGIQQSLRDALHDRDHALGLDSGGPIVAVLEGLARPSDTPVNSRAVFEVAADSEGHVTAVRLVDASEGFDRWDKLSAALRAALQSQHLRVPRGAAGVVVTL